MKIKDGRELVITMAKTKDARDVLKYMNEVVSESDNLTMGKGEFTMSLKEEEDFIRNTDMSKNSVMILGRVDGEIVSVGNLGGINKKRLEHRAGLGISVRKGYWNLGIGKIMMEKLIGFAKDNVYIEQIDLNVRSDNENAIKLYKNFGFKKYGTHEKAFKINGEYFDIDLMILHL